MNTTTILICDDNISVHESLLRYLREEHMQVLQAFDGKTALKLVREQTVDLVILDIMLPDISGMEICKQIRMIADIPILFLSARGEEIDRILGLELGADDYVTKPFSPREVVIRVKRILARTAAQTPGAEAGEESGDSVLRFFGLSLDPQTMDVRVNGEKVILTAREVHLMTYFLENAGRVLNREQILAAVWGYDYPGDTRAVDAAIKRIRQKLPDDNVQFEIRSIYGVGYRLQPKTDAGGPA